MISRQEFLNQIDPLACFSYAKLRDWLSSLSPYFLFISSSRVLLRSLYSKSAIFLVVSFSANSYRFFLSLITSISASNPLLFSSKTSLSPLNSPIIQTSISSQPQAQEATQALFQARVSLKKSAASARCTCCSKSASPWSFIIDYSFQRRYWDFFVWSYWFCLWRYASYFQAFWDSTLIIWNYNIGAGQLQRGNLIAFMRQSGFNRCLRQRGKELDQNQQEKVNNNFITMDQILENSYFHTNIKNKYSFPKSDRFPDLKAKYTIDFFQSSSMQKPRTTTFGYGSKYDFFRDTKKGPSPFQYSVREQDRLTQGLSFGRGRQEIKANSYIDLEKIKTPRAGAYNNDYQKVKKREPSCSIVGRRPQDSFIQPDTNPEPSKYNPIDSFYSRRKKSAEFAFGSAKRFDYGEGRANKMVGPGSYAVSPTNKSKLGTIGHASRKTYAVQEIEKSISPGPKYIVK